MNIEKSEDNVSSLKKYSIDLVEQALKWKIDPVIWREEEIDKLKHEVDIFERESNFWEIARIKYVEIPTKTKEIEIIENKLKELHDSWKSFLKRRRFKKFF